jgi:hypothetical protein
MNTIPTIQKTKSVRIPITEDDGDDNDGNNQPSNVSLIIIFNHIK